MENMVPVFHFTHLGLSGICSDLVKAYLPFSLSLYFFFFTSLPINRTNILSSVVRIVPVCTMWAF